MAEEIITTPLKLYYVYELIDPFTNEVFYVGKGTGERPYHHIHDALDSNQAETPKLLKIKEIIKALGGTLYSSSSPQKSEIVKQTGEKIIRVIGRYDNEDRAYSVEATLIHWVYGFENLTNDVGGHYSDTIRVKGDDSVIEGLDIPKKERVHDGSYTRDEFQKGEVYQVGKAMKELKEYLEDKLEIQFSPVDGSKASWTSIVYEVKSAVKLVVGKYHRKKGSYFIEVYPMDGKKESRQIVQDLSKRSYFEEKGEGAYAKLPGYGTKLTDEIEVLEDFQHMHKELVKVLD